MQPHRGRGRGSDEDVLELVGCGGHGCSPTPRHDAADEARGRGVAGDKGPGSSSSSSGGVSNSRRYEKQQQQLGISKQTLPVLHSRVAAKFGRSAEAGSTRARRGSRSKPHQAATRVKGELVTSVPSVRSSGPIKQSRCRWHTFSGAHLSCLCRFLAPLCWPWGTSWVRHLNLGNNP